MILIEKLALVLGMVLFMEGFAWATHKYVMHSWGWGWHKSHHEPHSGPVEKNDLYALVADCGGRPESRPWAETASHSGPSSFV